MVPRMTYAQERHAELPYRGHMRGVEWAHHRLGAVVFRHLRLDRQLYEMLSKSDGVSTRPHDVLSWYSRFCLQKRTP